MCLVTLVLLLLILLVSILTLIGTRRIYLLLMLWAHYRRIMDPRRNP